MKKLMSTLVLSVGALFATTLTQAGPYEGRQSHAEAAKYHAQAAKYHAAKHYDDKKQQFNHSKSQKLNPSRDWRTGQLVPRQYLAKRYEISDREARRLPQVSRSQQWYKISGDYVLVNERSGRVVRIING